LQATTGLLTALTIGTLSGLGLTWLTVSSGAGLDHIEVGPWKAWPQIGTQDADRYARASVARSGELPLAAGEGLAFTARTDSEGSRLDGRCRYRIEGISPPARWWTITLYDKSDQLYANPANRYGFSSAEVLRAADGTASMRVGSQPQPGNWLPSPEAPFRLVLRLYDTPISSGLGTEETVSLPEIVSEGCG
jgi:hypothetical protein